MGSGEVADVDIVADAGAIRRVVIVAEDFESRAAARGGV
jgi:hypothetical protein